MASQPKEGDRVTVVDRDPTPADEKNGTFYSHYRNLTGTLEKLYDDGMAGVTVELDSLPEELAKRHKQLTDKAKKKWLEGLSDEARNRLTSDEKQFQMRYTILVKVTDLQKATGKPAAPPAEKPEPAAEADTAEPPKAEKPDKAVKAVTTSDLDKAEEEALKARQQKKE